MAMSILVLLIKTIAAHKVGKDNLVLNNKF